MLRQIFHVIVSVLLWVVFVYYWMIVVRRPMNPDTKMALICLAVLIALSAAYLFWWVYYNIRLHRKVGERRVHRRDAPEPTHDYLGRELLMENREALGKANYIRVIIRDRITSRKKLFWPDDFHDRGAP